MKSKLNKHQQKNIQTSKHFQTHILQPQVGSTPTKNHLLDRRRLSSPGSPSGPTPGSRLDTNKTTKVLSRLREWKSVPNYLLEFAPRFAFSVNWLGRFSVAENSGYFFLERQLGGKRACVKLATWFCVFFSDHFLERNRKMEKCTSGWWFQPLWKIFVKLKIFPK